MERTPIKPHMAWSGPQPDREIDAYLLAMLLRLYSSGREDDSKRDTLTAPSVLTTKNLRVIAVMYAFYHARMEETGVRTVEGMLKLIRDCAQDAVWPWANENDASLHLAEAELIEFVDTERTAGFRCFG